VVGWGTWTAWARRIVVAIGGLAGLFAAQAKGRPSRAVIFRLGLIPVAVAGLGVGHYPLLRRSSPESSCAAASTICVAATGFG